MEFINGIEGMNVVYSPLLRLVLQTIVHALSTISELLIYALNCTTDPL